MAKKFTDFTAILGADVADEDLLCIVDYDADNTQKITVEELSNAIFLLVSEGGISAVSVEVPITAKTGDYSVLGGDNNDLFTNEGTTGLVTFTLPTAAAGLKYTFYVQDVDGIKVEAANSSDTIQIEGLVSDGAGFVESYTVGSSITLVAINATEWVAIAMLGTWSVDGETV